jgi:hypothetical protein
MLPFAISLLLVPPAFAGETPLNCTPAGHCVGDHIYAVRNMEVHEGDVSVAFGSWGDVTVGLGLDALNFHDAEVAVSKGGACLPTNSSACVGRFSHRKNDRGSDLYGKVIGILPSAGVVLLQEGKRTTAVGNASGISFSDVSEEPHHSFNWVVEQGKVVGCTDEMEVPSRPAHAGSRQRSFSGNLKTCRAVLPTKPAWLKAAGSTQCVLLGENPDGKSKLVVDRLDSQECDHEWYEIPSANSSPTYGGQFDFSPRSHFGVADLVPEVMNLTEKQIVPPEVYDKYDSVRIALTLNYKMYKDYEEEKSRASLHPSYDFLDGTELQLVIPEKVLGKVLENGILNQHQTHTSSAALGGSERALAEDKFLGYHLESHYGEDKTGVANQIRPKYALLGLQAGIPNDTPIADTQTGPGYAHNYGNIVVVFNNEVKDRTTFTMMDSLKGVNSVAAKWDRVRTLRYKSDQSLAGESGEYVEAQIWGKLDASDINHFLVNCPRFAEVSPAAMKMLKASGKPVYKCEEESSTRRAPHVVRLLSGQLIP